MNGYNNVFENSITSYNTYLNEKKELEQLFNNFYLDYKKFGFIHNGDFPPDLEAIEICNKINSDLYEKYIETNNNKKLIGHSSISMVNAKYNQLDSRHIMMSIILFDYLSKNNISIENIIEIGGGFGNWLRLNNKMQKFSKWYIIDLPHLGELQQWYLTKHDISREKYQIVSAYNYNSLPESISIDLVIGTHSLSEFEWSIFEKYFNTILINSKYLFYCYHKFLPSVQLINKKLELILSKFKQVVSFTSENGCVENTLFKLI